MMFGEARQWFGMSMVVGLLLAVPAGAVVVDLEEFAQPPYSLGAESYYNGSDGAGGFTSGGATFNNSYNPTYMSWSGWAVSNTTDTTTPGYGNQYSAFAGSGADGSAFYGVGYCYSPGDSQIELPAGAEVQSVEITNTTYTALTIRDGDAFTEAFGGPTGDDPDWFMLTIVGLDAAGGEVGAVDFYLADYRAADNSEDYVVDTWQTVDLSSLSGATTLSFGLSSSDVGQWGMNTPAYFAMDNLAYVPEPAAIVLVLAALVIRRR